MKRWLTGKRGTRMDWWKKIPQVRTCTAFLRYLQYWTPNWCKEWCQSTTSLSTRLVSWFTNSKYSSSLYNYLNFVSPGSLHCVCLVSDAVSGSASQSSSANDISSMSTEQTLASDTDSSSIDTLTGPLDESQWTQFMATWFLPPIYNIQISINHHLPFFSLLPHPPIFCFFLSLFCLVFLSSLTSMNRSIFLFSFCVSYGGSCWSSSTSNFVLDCCLEVKAIYSVCWVKGLSFSSLWILFNLIKYIYDVCIPIDFQVTGGGGLLFVLYACILIVLFF